MLAGVLMMCRPQNSEDQQAAACRSARQGSDRQGLRLQDQFNLQRGRHARGHSVRTSVPVQYRIIYKNLAADRREGSYVKPKRRRC